MTANPHFTQIRILLEAKQFSKATEVLAELHDTCLHDADYWWLVAVCHGEQGNHDAALSALESATTYCPLDVQSQVLLGKLYSDRGYTLSAVAIFEHLANSAEAISQHRTEIIRQLGRLKRYELVVELCVQATEADPDDWQVWFAKAYYLGRCGDANQQMVEALERALTLKPEQLSVRISLVRVLAALGREAATQHVAGEISIQQIRQLGCSKCVCQLARIYQSAGDRLRWKACVQQDAALRRRRMNDA